MKMNLYRFCQVRILSEHINGGNIDESCKDDEF